MTNTNKRKQQKNRVLQVRKPNTKYTRLLPNKKQKKKPTFMQELKKDGLLLECVIYAFIFLFTLALMPTLYLNHAIDNSTIEGLSITAGVTAMLILLCFRCFWIGWNKPKQRK